MECTRLVNKKIQLRIGGLLWLVWLGLSAGCAGKGNLVGAGQFNPELLRQGGVIVAGVVDATADRASSRAGIGEARQLEEALQAWQPAMPVRGAARVREAMGRTLYRQMLEDFRFHGMAGTLYMNMIAARLPKVRYLAFAMIQDERVVKSYEALASADQTRLEVARMMAVNVYIYDLQARQELVWAAALQEAAVEQRTVFHSGGEPDPDMYPPPPARPAVLKTLFPKLVDHLTSG